MSFIGLWLDRYGGDVEVELVDYQPEILVVGIGAWQHIGRMVQVCPSLKMVTLRNTNKPLLNRFPLQLADEQCNYMDGLVAQSVRRDILYAHGPDEEHSNFDGVIGFEERWLERVQQRGYKAIGWNCSYGWNYHALSGPQKARLRAHWAKLDLIGRHAYVGWLFNANPPKEAPIHDTIFAPFFWEGFPIEKWLATEGGFDFWSTGPGDPGYQGEGSPGWKETGLTEQQVTARILEVCEVLWSKGAAGYTVYLERAQNEEEWRNFYITDLMRQQWKSFRQLRLPTGEAMPVPPELDQAMSVILEFKRKINEAKTNNATWFELATDLEKADSLAGDAYNLVDKAKKALTSPPV